MMENSEKKRIDWMGIASKFCSYGSKISVLILFLLLFIGRINPARISEAIGKDVSLIKSAVYYKSLTEDIVALDKSFGVVADYSDSDTLLETPSDEEAEGAGGGKVDFSDTSNMSMEDIYAAMAAMVGEGFEVTSDGSGGSAWTGDLDYEKDANALKGQKIIVPKYSEKWKAFTSAHPEIAAAMNYDRFAAVFLLVAVLIAAVGAYISCGTKIFKKIGCIVIMAGGALALVSLVNFGSAYNKLAQAGDLMINARAIIPSGRETIAAFSIIVILFAVGVLALEIMGIGSSSRAAQGKDKSVSGAVGKNGKIGFESHVAVSDGKAVNSIAKSIEKTTLPAYPFQATYRILALLAFLLLFIPGANPARISAKISRSMSLFTSGFFYKVFTDNLQYIFRRAWMPESIMRLANVSSLFVCLGIIVCGVGACMSVGNNKLKRIAHFCLLGGSAVSFSFLFGILHAYNQLVAFGNLDRNQPLEPSGIIIFAPILLLIFVCSVISFLKTPAPEKGEKYQIDAPLQLFLMLLPFLILIFVFSYLPLWGWRYAFFDYKAGEVLNMEKWVGWKWFLAPFTNPATRTDVIRVLRNTLAMSGLGILTSWCPMVFAIFLSEIKNSASRRVIQTLTTIPNFISWVLVYAIAFCIFGTEGFVNNLLVKQMHVMERGQNYLMGSSGVWVKMLLWGMWKGLGWSAIMYIAAISGIDQQLYEAATVDGAGRFQKMWHITLPELIPTYIVLLILSISNILSNGMDQYLVFKNPDNKEMIEVLDLYVYQITLGTGGSGNNIPFSTVVSMFKSLVSVILLFVTNRISKFVRGSSIF